MAVRSKRLAVLVPPGAVSTVMYTAPSGETALVKYFTVWNSSALAASVQIAIRPAGSGQQYFWFLDTLAGNDGVREEVWLVLHPGDEVIVFATASNTFMVTLHGAELEGVAD